MLHVQESVNLKIYLYAQTKGQRGMLYIRKFYVVKNIIYILAVGVALRATPTPSWWGRFAPPQAPPRA